MDNDKFNLHEYLQSIDDTELRNLYNGSLEKDSDNRTKTYQNFLNVVSKYLKSGTCGCSVYQAKVNVFRAIMNEGFDRFMNG